MIENNEITIKSRNFEYEIIFSEGLRLCPQTDYIILVDEKVEAFVYKLFPDNARHLTLKIDETAKSYEACGLVIEKLLELNIRRKTTIYAIGGGALQDIVTFISAIYMRGLEWQFIPSTLMSMLDSCIGGKSSINFKNNKNLIGNFNPPSKIYIFPSLLKTLNDVDIVSGLAEGYKITYARDQKSFMEFCNSVEEYRHTAEPEFLKNAIEVSLRAKKWFIEIDEFDQAERQLLNFGHSYGHALEAATNYSVPHGLAVFIGMAAALERSGVEFMNHPLGIVICKEVSRVSKQIIETRISKEIFIKSLSNDKKNSSHLQRLVLPSGQGSLNLVEFSLNLENLERCFADLIQALKILKVDHEVF